MTPKSLILACTAIALALASATPVQASDPVSGESTVSSRQLGGQAPDASAAMVVWTSLAAIRDLSKTLWGPPSKGYIPEITVGRRGAVFSATFRF